VAVRAPDLAFRDLLENRRPREACFAHVSDVFALIAKVVELEDNWVSFPAVNARMLR
jgi:hypothetical protein